MLKRQNKCKYETNRILSLEHYWSYGITWRNDVNEGQNEGHLNKSFQLQHNFTTEKKV